MQGSITKHTGTTGKVSWVATVDLPRDPVTGKRRQKRITAPTRKEAEAKAAALITTIDTGGFGEATAGKLTVTAYLAQWLDAARQTVRPGSARRYERALAQHVEPFIGRVLLAKLTPLDVQRLYAARLEAGLSPTTVALLHNILHRALKQAVRWGLLTRNVTEAVDVPRATVPDYATWNADQAVRFLAVADADPLAALWRLALLTGMRRGEILGLRWEDVDLARGALSVRHTLISGATGALEDGQPKTKAGRRQVALPRSVVDSLQRHRIQQLEARLQAGPAYADAGLVFADALGAPVHPSPLRRRFLALIAEAGATAAPVSRPAAHVGDPDAGQWRAPQNRAGAVRPQQHQHYARPLQPCHAGHARGRRGAARSAGRGRGGRGACDKDVTMAAPWPPLCATASLKRLLGAEDEIRTRDPLLGKEMLYH